jgi:hypothetical protein
MDASDENGRRGTYLPLCDIASASLLPGAEIGLKHPQTAPMKENDRKLDMHSADQREMLLDMGAMVGRCRDIF